MRTRSQVLGAALIPLLLATACAESPNARKGITVTSPPPPASNPATPKIPSARADAVRRAAPAVESFCRSKFPDHYAGLAIGPDQERLIVYRRPVAAFDAAVREKFPRLDISFEDARYSERELTALTHRILADVDYWRERGVVINGVGPAGDGNSVIVRTTDPKPAQRVLRKRYGSAVNVQRGEVMLIPTMRSR